MLPLCCRCSREHGGRAALKKMCRCGAPGLDARGGRGVTTLTQAEKLLCLYFVTKFSTFGHILGP